ncbi:hypothetical protein MTBBW1_830034 [Desulfamplus magnetovallimortis]|uniref:Uncharacterized protein n=1 Tax=Desulfamplus magnetovallimortis TaxID=1246637 RepID=A0A1W1HKQ6_9BACT|nr:hypothetical protein MTBBW1_830034 [Desulfamplus magnetovallimortis]
MDDFINRSDPSLICRTRNAAICTSANLLGTFFKQSSMVTLAKLLISPNIF